MAPDVCPRCGGVMATPLTLFVSVAEAAEIAGVERWVVYHWVRKGALEALAGPGGLRLIRRDELQTLLASTSVDASA